MNSPDRACHLAKQAFDEAIAEVRWGFGPLGVRFVGGFGPLWGVRWVGFVPLGVRSVGGFVSLEGSFRFFRFVGDSVELSVEFPLSSPLAPTTSTYQYLAETIPFTTSRPQLPSASLPSSLPSHHSHPTPPTPSAGHPLRGVVQRLNPHHAAAPRQPHPLDKRRWRRGRWR